MVLGTHGVDVDTFSTNPGDKDVGTHKPINQAATPKHCNKQGASRMQGHGVPGFQPQAYHPHYAYRHSGLYKPNSHSNQGPNRGQAGGPPSNYYGGQQSVIVSPGGNSYMRRPSSSYYHSNEYENPGQPQQNNAYSQYHNQQRPPPPPPPSSFQQPMYNTNVHDQPLSTFEMPSQNGMDFSRAVSTSFGENNSNNFEGSTEKMTSDKESSDSIPSLGNFYKTNDDCSIASKADSDTSWRMLNQVASIEEEKFRDAEAGRLDVSSLIHGQSSNTSSRSNQIKKEATSTQTERVSLPSLTKAPSVQEPLEASSSRDELDLIQCSSSGSLLFATHDEPFAKRSREGRCDNDDVVRGRGDDEIRGAPSRSPPNVANLSMKDKDSARPPKKRRSVTDSDCYDNSPSYSFSLESAPSFPKDSSHHFGTLSTLREKTDSFDDDKDKNESRKVDILSSNLSWDIPGQDRWEITGQDSFGGNLSVTSNLSGNVGEGPVITSSFSFGKEKSNGPDFTDIQIPNNSESSKEIKSVERHVTKESLPINRKNSHPSENESRNQSFDNNDHRSSHPHTHGKYPPHAPTWVTNTSSYGRDQPEAQHSQHMGHPADHYNNNPPAPMRTFSQPGPPRPMHHQHEMMRNYSQESDKAGPPSVQGHPHSHYGPLHGPYGAPLPPHMPQSDSHLPPNFRPPHPPMPNHPHLMNHRRPPQAVYIMSSPPGGRPGMARHSSDASKVAGSVSGGVYSWTKQDDRRLTDIMKKFKNPKDWEPIAKEFGRGKTPKECHERWIRYLKPGVRKGQWQDHEDAIVVEAVSTSKEQPFTRWSDLATRLPGRVGKQIRDRWVNHLNPNINHMPFTREDDLLLWDGHAKLGKRWVEISSKYFNSSRSENHIKNRWYSASFKKFIANEFGADAYNGGKKKSDKAGKGSQGGISNKMI